MPLESYRDRGTALSFVIHLLVGLRDERGEDNFCIRDTQSELIRLLVELQDERSEDNFYILDIQ